MATASHSSSPPDTPDSNLPSILSQAQIKIHPEANEETQILIERKIAKGLLDEYFGPPNVHHSLDSWKPTIGHRTPDGKEHVLPDENVAFYRVEREGKVHALHLCVHAGPPHTHRSLNRVLAELFKMKEKGGRLDGSEVFGILQFGLEISFYTYNGKGIENLGGFGAF